MDSQRGWNAAGTAAGGRGIPRLRSATRSLAWLAFLTVGGNCRHSVSIERLLPHAFCGGEAGRRPDEGAFDCRVNLAPTLGMHAFSIGSRSQRTCLPHLATPPSSAFGTSIGESWDGGVRNAGFRHMPCHSESSGLHGIAGTALQSSAFSPTLFVGEKVAEGRMRGRLTVALTSPQPSGGMPFQSGRARKERVCPILQRPPHPPSAPSPPEKHGGRRRSIGERWDRGVRNAGFRPGPCHSESASPLAHRKRTGASA